jgi:beta-phosphoglucomutase-like phosphatase (HAD superfamily)
MIKTIRAYDDPEQGRPWQIRSSTLGWTTRGTFTGPRFCSAATSGLCSLDLSSAGTAAVVSNIGWDLRTVFHFHDIEQYIDAFVLSYEHGAKKPDPQIFQTACDKLGIPPSSVLMVGDDRNADTGAAALGCPVHLVATTCLSAPGQMPLPTSSTCSDRTSLSSISRSS